MCRILPIVLILVLSACQSDQIDNRIVDSGTPVSFANDIQPIFNASCGGAGCHMPAATNGVRLGSYAQVMASTGDSYGGPIVVAGDASSPILDKLGSAPQFGSRMPLGGSALNAEAIGRIRSWILDGALNN